MVARAAELGKLKKKCNEMGLYGAEDEIDAQVTVVESAIDELSEQMRAPLTGTPTGGSSDGRDD